jgi:hypothetical protein
MTDLDTLLGNNAESAPTFLPFSQWSADKEAEDPVKLKVDYSDYIRESYILQGKKIDPSTEEEIRTGLYSSLVADGKLAEGDMESFSKLIAPPETPFEEKFKLVKTTLGYDDPDQETLNQYTAWDKALKSMAAEDITPESAEKLAQLRSDAEFVVAKRYNDVKREAIRNNELPFAVINQEDGSRKILVSDRATELNLVSALKQSKLGGVTLADAYLAQQQLEIPDGYTVPRFKADRHAEVTSVLSELADKNESLNEIIEGRSTKLARKEYDGIDQLEQSLNDLGQQAVTGVQKLLGKVVSDTFTKSADKQYNTNRSQLRWSYAHDEEMVSNVSRILADTKAIPNAETFSQEEISRAISDLALRNANESGKFNLYKDDNEIGKNIRFTSLGAPVIHPSALANEDIFNKTLNARPDISDKTKETLKTARVAQLTSSFNEASDLLGRSGVSDEWNAALMEGRQQGKQNYDILNDFLKNEDNYNEYAERLKGIGFSVMDSVSDLVYAIPAAKNVKWAQDILVEDAQRRSDRRAVASLFGADMGFGQDIAEAIAPLVVDLTVTALLTAATAPAFGVGGAAYLAAKQGARLTVKGLIKAVTSSAFKVGARETAEQAAKRLVTTGLIKESVKDVTGKGALAAIKGYNGLVAQRIGGAAASFIPAATRSGASTYGSVFSALSQNKELNLSREEIHERALGAALSSGAITGIITSAFGSFGKAGVEDALLRGMTYKQAHSLLSAMANTKNLSDDVFKAAVKNQLAASLKKFRQGAVKGVAKDMLDEAEEEGLDQLLNGFVEDAALNKNTPMLERIKTSMYAAAMGATLGGAVPVIGQIGKRIAPNKQAILSDAARLQQEFYEGVSKRLEESGSPITAQLVRQTLRTRVSDRTAPPTATDEFPIDGTEPTAPTSPNAPLALGAPSEAAGLPAPRLGLPMAEGLGYSPEGSPPAPTTPNAPTSGQQEFPFVEDLSGRPATNQPSAPRRTTTAAPTAEQLEFTFTEGAQPPATGGQAATPQQAAAPQQLEFAFGEGQPTPTTPAAPVTITPEAQTEIDIRQQELAALAQPIAGEQKGKAGRSKKVTNRVEQLQLEIDHIQQTGTTEIPADLVKKKRAATKAATTAVAVEQPSPIVPEDPQPVDTPDVIDPNDLQTRVATLPQAQADQLIRDVIAQLESDTPTTTAFISADAIDQNYEPAPVQVSTTVSEGVKQAAIAVGIDPAQSALEQAQHIARFDPDQNADVAPKATRKKKESKPKQAAKPAKVITQRVNKPLPDYTVQYDPAPFQQKEQMTDDERGEMLSVVRLANKGFPLRFNKNLTYGVVSNKNLADKSDFMARAVYATYPLLTPDIPYIEQKTSSRKTTYFDPAQNKVVTKAMKMPIDVDGRGVFNNDPVLVAEMLAHKIPVYVPSDVLVVNPSFVIKNNYVVDVRMIGKDGSSIESAVNLLTEVTDFKPNNQLFDSYSRLPFYPDGVEGKVLPIGARTINPQTGETVTATNKITFGELQQNIAQFISNPNAVGALMGKVSTTRLTDEFYETAIHSAATEYLLLGHLFEFRGLLLNNASKFTIPSPRGLQINPSKQNAVIKQLSARLKGNPDVETMAKDFAPLVDIPDAKKPSSKDFVLQFIEDFALNNTQFAGNTMPAFRSVLGKTKSRYAEQQKARGIYERNKAMASLSDAGVALEAQNVDLQQALANSATDLGGFDSGETFSGSDMYRAMNSLVGDAVDAIDNDPDLRDALNELAFKSIYPSNNALTANHVQNMPTQQLMARIGDWMTLGNHANRPDVLEFMSSLRAGGFNAGTNLRNALKLTAISSRIDGNPLEDAEYIAETQRLLSESLGRPISRALTKDFIKGIDQAVTRRWSRAVTDDLSKRASRDQNADDIARLGLISGDPESVIKALTQIAKSSNNPSHKLVAELLLEDQAFIRKVGFSYGESQARIAGEYVRLIDGSHSVFLNTERGNGLGLENVLLEEYVHAFLSDTLTKDPDQLTPQQRESRKRLEGLYQLALDSYQLQKNEQGEDGFNASLESGLENMDEFVANFLLDPEFQQFIKTLRPPMAQRGFFQRIIEAMVSMFRKISGKESKAYTQAFKDIVDLTKTTVRTTAVPFKQQVASNTTVVARRFSEATDMPRVLMTSVSPTRARAAAATTISNADITQMDTDYLAAVNRGDMETAQRMVDEAAKIAGYNVEGWHGSTSKGFTEFDTQQKDVEVTTTSDGRIEFNTSPFARGAHFGTKEQAITRGRKMDSLMREGFEVRKFFLKLNNPKRVEDIGSGWGRVLDSAINEGHDGLVYSNKAEGAGDSFLLRNPSQIKSADPVTRDSNGKVIPLSQRFNPASKSILYSSTRAQVSNKVSQPSNEFDHLRVGTAKLGTDDVPEVTPNTSNISTDIVPQEILEEQMKKINYAHLPDDILKEKNYRVKKDKFVAWLKDNLLALYNAFPPDLRARATQWYDGANKIANDFADIYGTTPHQAAGVIAVLSPQKDWFKNVAQAEQIMDIWANLQDFVIEGDAVQAQIESMVTGVKASAKNKIKAEKGETPEEKAYRIAFNEKLDQKVKKKRRLLLNQIVGKTIRELDNDPDLQAWAIRLVAQAQYGRQYQIISPEGNPLGVALTKKNKPQKNGWGSCNEIIKAVNILKNGDIQNISENVGGEHKVRNFYNNIIAPNNLFGDATIDTHAVAAGHLMPMGSSATAVNHNFGTGMGGSGKLGISGVYHIYLDAYQQAAAEVGLMPRQLQSITWEAIRLIYPSESRRNKEILDTAQNTWKNKTYEQARNNVLGGTIPSPSWARTDNDGQPASVTKKPSKKRNKSDLGRSILFGSGVSRGDGGRGGIDSTRPVLYTAGFARDHVDLLKNLQTASAQADTVLKTQRQRDDFRSLMEFMESRMPYGFNLVVDETLDGAAAADSEGNVIVNPEIMLEVLSKLDPLSQRGLLESIINEEIGHGASYNSLSQQDIDEIASSLSDADFDTIAREYYANTPERIQEVMDNLKSDNPFTVARQKEVLVQEKLRMRMQQVTRGYTTEDDNAFWSSKPSLLAILKRYIGGVLNRFVHTRRIRGRSNALDAATFTLIQEMEAISLGFSRTPVMQPLDPDAPAVAIETYNRILNRDIIAEIEEAQDAEEAAFEDTEQEDEGAPNLLFTRPSSRPRTNANLSNVDFAPVVQLLEMPIFEYGTYQSPKGWMNMFRGDLSKPMKRLFEQRDEFKRAVSQLVISYKEKMDKLVLEAYGDKAAVDWQLIAKAQGHIDGNILNSSTLKAIDNVLNIELDAIAKNTALTEAQKKVERAAARQRRDTAITVAEDAAIQAITVERDAALQKLALVSSDLATHIVSMRRDLIEPIQKKLIAAGIDPDIGLKIDKTGGIYITRAYEMFNDPTYADRVRTDPKYATVRAAAMQFFTDNLFRTTYDRAIDNNMTPADAAKLANDTVLKANRSAPAGSSYGAQAMEAFLSKYDGRSSISPQNTKGLRVLENNLKNRKDLPKELRDLLGEYGAETGTDLIVRTFSTVAMVAAQQTFLNNLATTGITQGFFVDAVTYAADPLKYPDYVPVRNGGSSKNDPLKHMYAPKEMVEVLGNVLDSSFVQQYSTTAEKAVGDMALVIRNLTGKAMAAKTLGSVGYYLRNMLGNMLFFAPAQGFYNVHKIGARSATYTLGKMVDPNKIDDYIAEMIGLGIIGDEIESSLMRELLNGKTTTDSMMDKLDKFTQELPVVGQTRQALEWVQKKATDLSGAIDAAYKLEYFEFELDYLKRAQLADPTSSIARLSEYDLKRMAADKVKMTAQSMSQSIPLANAIKKSTFGVMFAPFVSFKMEVPRIVVNTYKLGWQERGSDNAMIRRRGYMRMGSMTIMLGIFSAALPAFLAWKNDIGEEEEEALRKSMPEYLRGHTFYFHRGDDGQLTSLDLTYLNPFSLMIDPIMRAMPKLFKGDVGGVVGELVRGLIFGTYLDDQILAGNVMDVKDNKNATTSQPIWIEGVDDFPEATAKALGYIFEKTYTPRILSDALDALNAAGGDYTGFANSPVGQLIDGMYPVKVHPVDVEKQYRRYLFEHVDKINAVNKRKYELYSREAIDQEDIERVYDDEMQGRRKLNQELLRVARGFEGLGLTAPAQFQTMKASGIGKDKARLLFYGVMDRPDINKQFAEGLVKRGYTDRLQKLYETRNRYNRYIFIEDPK